jgi:hypothetical protein
MKRTFIETDWFTEEVYDYLTEEEFREFQRELLANPRRGVVVAGSGGLRKIRFSHQTRGKGKRGGVRIYYLDIPKAERVYLIDIHDKNEKEDLTQSDRKVLKKVVNEIKKTLL